MTTQALTIRIGADANGAISVISQTTTAVNNLGNAGTRANSGVASLTGGVQNLGRWSGQTTSATASLTGGVNGLSRATLDAVNGTSRLNQQLAENTRVTNAAAGSMRSLTSVLGAFGITVGAVGLAEFAKSIVRNGMEIESLRAQLNMTLPSLAAAKESFNLIVKIAKETPQSISEISKAYIMMNNMGLSPTERAMRGLTDMAAKLGGASDTLTGVIRGLGQAWMKGALHAQDTNQMIERGVPVYALLVKVTGKTTAELIKMMEAGELTRPVMEKLHEELFKWGEGSSAKAMETTRGKIEALGSAWSAFSDVVMNSGVGKLLKAEIDGMTTALEYFTKKLNTTVDEQIAQKQVRLVELKKGFDDDKFTYLKPNTTASRIEEYKQTEIFLAQLLRQKQKGIDDVAQYQKDKDTQAQGEKLAEEMATNKAIANGDTDALKKFMSAKLSAIDEVNKKIIQTEAEIAGIPAKLAMAIVSVESTGKVDALNKDSGAAGLMQVMPANYQKQGYTQNQMLTDASIGVRSGLKVYQDSLDVAKNAVKKGIIEVSQTIDYANALYTTKHKTIADRIAKNGGVFDMELMPAATRDWSNKFNAALALQNTTVTESGKFAQRAAKEMKDSATAQEQAAKKITDNDRQLTESTAFGKYNATIDELTEAHKRFIDTQGKSGISQATYSQSIENSNETLLKNTDYVQENIKLLDQQAKEYAKLVGHVDDYNATIDELTRNKQRGAITPEQYGLDVAKANAGLMNDAANAYPNAKIPNIPIEKAGEVIDKKNINDAAKETQKFHDEITKTTAAFDTLGNSGKMAFDGLLGGISAVASAATSFSEEMTKLNDNFAKGSKDYSDYMMQAGLSEEQRKTATADYYKMKDRYESASFQAEISGARQIAGATAKMFTEKSAARKAFHAIEMGLAVVEMAMSAKKMVVDVAAGAANMFAQSGWGGFAGVAAMAAVMGGLGFAMSGGSSEPKDMRALKETDTTGSVLGDSAKSSNSIDNSLTLLNDTGNKQLLELKDLNSNFTNLVKGVDKTVAQAISLHGSFTPSTQGMSQAAKNPLGSGGAIAASLGASVALGATGAISTAGLYAGAALINAGATSLGIGISTAAATSATMAGTVGAAMGATGMAATMVGGAILGLAGGLILAAAQYGLGKLLGIGKTKYEAIGNGIITGIGEMTAQGMKEAVVAYDYSTVKATTKGWFSDTKKIYDVINGIDNEMTVAFTDLFGSLGKTLYSAFNGLGISDLVQKSAVVPPMKFDLSKAKTDQEISDVMTKAINTMSDKLATEIAGGLFAPLQKAGEGMLETITRVTSEVANVSAGFARLGISMKVSGMAAIGLSDALVSLYASAPSATDGLKNFISAMSAFIDTVLTPLQKFKFSSENWSAFAGGFNEKTGLKLSTNIANLTRDEIMTAYTATSEKLRAASEAESVYTKQQQTVKDATNPVTATDLANQLNAVWKPIIGKSYESATWGDIPAEWKSIIEQRAIGGTDKTELYQEMKRVFDTNTAKSTSAKQVLGEGFNLQQFEDGMSQAKSATVDAASSVAALTNSVDLLKAAFDFENKTLSIQENVLKQITSARQTTERQRATELSQIDNEIDIRTKLTQTTVNAFDAWNKTNGNLILTQNALQKFNHSLEDTAKSTKSLADATKYFDSFTQNIKSWIQNLKATQLGSPESQFNAAKDNFAAQMKIINGGLATSAEEKQAALSGITGVADTYIAAIKNNYASTEKGQELIAQVVEQVSGLTTSVDVQQLQLGVLQQIRDGVHDIPTGISDTQKEFFTGLATKIDSAQKTYISAPTSQNDLIANTLAKEWTMAVDYATKGSGFLDAFIKSFDGKTGLNAAVNLIFDDKSLNATQAQTAIDNVLSKVISLVNIEVVPRFLTTVAQREIDQQIALLNPPPIYLNIDTTSAVSVIKSVTDTATDAIKAINKLDALGSLTAINPSIYNASEMRQTVTPQLMQSSPFAVEPKIGGGIPADSSILKRLSSIDVARNSSAGNSSSDTKETVEELKKQTAELAELVRQTTALLKLQIAANQELVEKMNSMDESLKTTAKKTRLQAVK